MLRRLAEARKGGRMENITYRTQFKDYLNENFELIRSDQKDGVTGRLKMNDLTVNETELQKKMWRIRQQYKKRYETMQRPYPSVQPFYKVKSMAEKSELYTKVFKKMPKGGLLHVHSTAGLSVERLLMLLKAWQNIQNTDYKIMIVTIQDINQTKVASGTLLYACQVKEAGVEGYVEPLDAFLKEEGNEQWLKELLSFSSDRAEQFTYKWDEFNTIFSRTSRLFMNSVFYYVYHIEFFKECIEDNIYYVELRCGYEEFTDKVQSSLEERLGEKSDCNAKNYVYKKDMAIEISPWDNPLDSYFLDIIMEACDAVNESCSKSGEKFIVKIILCARRDLSPYKKEDRAKLLKKLDTAIVLKNTVRYKDIILGFDFVSEEDRGQITDAYAEDIIYGSFGTGYEDVLSADEKEKLGKLIQQEAENGVSGPRIELIDFYLHDGESTWNNNFNVSSASIICRKRIGHGFNMVNHPGTVRAVATNGGTINSDVREPVLEICPISNQLLGYHPDLRTHPACSLMRSGIACCIANDDPQLFGNPGVSYDFWSAYMAMDLDLEQIKAMVYTAYYYYQTNGCGEANENIIRNNFDYMWESFVARALAEWQ